MLSRRLTVGATCAAQYAAPAQELGTAGMNGLPRQRSNCEESKNKKHNEIYMELRS